jgi:hypothetical protein
MKILFLTVFIFMATPALAQISSDRGISEPQYMAPTSSDDRRSNAGKMEPEDPDFESTKIPIASSTPANGEIDPFDPVIMPTPRPEPRQNVRQVLKKVPSVQVERSIADDRIDDGYVQGLIKQNFDFNNPIE